VSVLIVFVIIPIIIGLSSGTIDVVRVNKVIKPNTLIEKDSLIIEKVGRANLPKTIIKDPAELIGKYSRVELMPGDNLVKEKFINRNDIEDSYLYNLVEDNKMAVSITMKSFASGLSGKIKPGDLISLMYFNKDSMDVSSPRVIAHPELSCVDVVAVDRNSESSNDLGSITVLATREQALLIVEAENAGNIHVAFVGRGDATREALLGGVQ
jgi:pilus assembly protein CpaB